MPADLERVIRGEPVACDPAAVDRTFSELWRALAERGEQAVTRAALWNVVAHAEGDEVFRAVKRVLDELAPRVPARVIVLHPAEQAEGLPELAATIELNAVAGHASRAIRSEEVTVVGRGAGQAHFASLVRALVLPGLPTALYWAGRPPRKGRLARELLASADRLIVDSGGRDVDDQVALRDLVAAARGEAADLGWLRIGPVRQVLATLFDPPVGAAPLHRAARVVVHADGRARAAALLLCGWLTTRLAWREPEAVHARDQGWRWRLSDPAGGRRAVEILPARRPAGQDGILLVEIHDEDRVYAVEDAEGGTMELRAPDVPPRTLLIDERPDADLLAAALGHRGRDPLYGEALARAAEMAEAAEWAR